MKSIGFKNFRRFHNFPEIDLGDITFLVGGNNSGKSTLVKALLLCAENVITMVNIDPDNREMFSRPKFNFDSKFYSGVKIKSFARALNNNSAKDTSAKFSKITFSFSYSNFNFEITVAGDPDADLATADIVYISIEDTKNKRSYEHDYENATMTFSILNDPAEILTHFFEIQSQIQNAQKELDVASAQETPNLERIAELNNRIEALSSRQAEFFAEHNELFEILKPKILPFKDEVGDDDNLAENVLEAAFTDAFTELNKQNTYTAPLHSFVFFGNVNLCESIIDDFISVTSVVPVPEGQEEFMQILKQDIGVIRKSKKDLTNILNALNVAKPIYITAHAATQNALYSTADLNDYNAVTIHEYFNSKINAGDAEYNFVIEWMKEFGIGSSFEVIPVAGEAFQVKIKDENGIDSLLADKGMGSIQLMILLLRLASIIRRHNLTFKHPNEKLHPLCPRIVIEEPEQNLHPAMQSKLAELFLYLNKKYNCEFLIETHSEYLIRKTQVLVARENYEDEKALDENNPFKVYYFNSDSEDEPCYPMKYQISGSFENSFGRGFFDAAAESDMEIIRKEYELKKRRK